MRILALVLNFVVGAALVTYSTDMLAARHKSGHHRLHGKSRHHHGKIARDPGNVWDRIRAGMRLPKPTPPEAFSSLSHTTPMSEPSVSAPATEESFSSEEKIKAELARKYTRLGMQHQILSRNRLVTPHIANLPLQNYTRYGRQRLNSTSTSYGNTNETIAQGLQDRQRHLLQRNSDYLTPGSHAQTRIRTQLAPPAVSSFNRTPNSNSEVIARHSDTMADNKIIDNPTQATSNQSQYQPSTSGQPAQDQSLMDKQRAKEEEMWRQQAVIYGRFKKEINNYAQRPDYLRRISERARPYLYHVVEELSQHNMPMELALLPVVESAYQPTALSPMSAAGIWQFIPSTGRDFNLVQNEYYDGRLDVTASTRAAVRFLYGLKNHFGDWLLALAAYNCGQGTVDAAISANRTAGLKTDYWSLNLPAETMDYVPRLLAVSHIFANSGVYGLRLNPVRNEPYFVKVKVDRKADIAYLTGKDLNAVAKMANLDYGQFCQLNPGYIQSTLHKDGPFTFLMPGASANHLRGHLDSVAKFLGQPTQLSANAPVKTETVEKTSPVMLSTVNDIVPIPSVKIPNITSPFVSLEVDKNKATLQSTAESVNKSTNAD